ncbi:hypothetical protein EBT31_08440 [bacterium]|nr:hypothetical protein [bacterium]
MCFGWELDPPLFDAVGDESRSLIEDAPVFQRVHCAFSGGHGTGLGVVFKSMLVPWLLVAWCFHGDPKRAKMHEQ